MGRSDEPWHGTVGGYTNRRCRCAECREAQRDYMRAYLAARPKQREKARRREAARYSLGLTTFHRRYPASIPPALRHPDEG